MKVLIVPNYSREPAMDGAHQLEDWLDRQGVESVWAPDKKLFPGKKADLDGVGLAVSLGGDGTLLRAARLIGYTEIPLMGISYGHLGFLTCGGPEDLISAVDAALDAEASRVDVDLADVPYIDSTGIGVLVGAAHRAQEAGRTFVVARPQRNVARVLSLLGVSEELNVHVADDADQVGATE